MCQNEVGLNLHSYPIGSVYSVQVRIWIIDDSSFCSHTDIEKNNATVWISQGKSYIISYIVRLSINLRLSSNRFKM